MYRTMFNDNVTIVAINKRIFGMDTTSWDGKCYTDCWEYTGEHKNEPDGNYRIGINREVDGSIKSYRLLELGE